MKRYDHYHDGLAVLTCIWWAALSVIGVLVMIGVAFWVAGRLLA